VGVNLQFGQESALQSGRVAVEYIHGREIMLIEEIELEVEKSIIEAFTMQMANLAPSRTGLPVVIWFGEVGGQHGPRIKVSNVKGKFAANDCFVMSVSRDPAVLTPKNAKLKSSEIEEIKDWVMLNYEGLMQAWYQAEHGEDPLEILLNLKKI
jgi:hypothetical protein